MTEPTEPAEQAVADYLAAHPDFFAAHPELLATLAVPHPQNGQAISLVERQSLVLRHRIGSLESHIAALKRHGAENDAIVAKLVGWARALLAQADAAALPDTALENLRAMFAVPYAALRLWEVAPVHAGRHWAAPVSADIRRLADSMGTPYAGPNAGFEAAGWLHDDVQAIRSLALLPLRVGASPEAFGLLVLGSGDRSRFEAGIGTDFLARFAELASAAFARLRS
jgi:hypothetical protein